MFYQNSNNDPDGPAMLAKASHLPTNPTQLSTVVD